MTSTALASIDADTRSGARPDGRQLRCERHHAKLIEVVRGLMASGEFQPRAEKIAGLAGLTTRSFYNHFDSASHAWELALDDTTQAMILARIMPNGPWPCAEDCGRIVRAAVFGRLSS